MKAIMDYIEQNWPGWVVVGIIFPAVGYLYAKVKAVMVGVQALLRDRIIQAYNHYQDKEYCPIYGKENVRRMYEAYHALGGNDVATKLKEELMNMPTEPEEKEKEI